MTVENRKIQFRTRGTSNGSCDPQLPTYAYQFRNDVMSGFSSTFIREITEHEELHRTHRFAHAPPKLKSRHSFPGASGSDSHGGSTKLHGRRNVNRDHNFRRGRHSFTSETIPSVLYSNRARVSSLRGRISPYLRDMPQTVVTEMDSMQGV